MQGSVLVVEDDHALREALCDTLELAGISTLAAADGQDALAQLQSQSIKLVVSDVQMQPMDGHSLLKQLRSERPELPVMLMTAYGTIQKAVQAIHDGAVDYLVKPFDAAVLVHKVSQFLAQPEEIEDADLVAVDPQTRQLAALARRVAKSEATVMITGESGTGKEVFARYIHRNSLVADGPFVAINCAAIPENMLESVLFGYEKGAFTGAYHAHPGKFEQANGGTLLLDEISEMDLGLQAKLLRVLQEREVERLGARKTIPLNVRVLATSNRDLMAEVQAGNFREDLYYRLNVFPLHLVPLAARPDDIVALVHRMIESYAPKDKALPGLAPAAKARLLEHAWPGNVRELDNVIQRALILHGGNQIEAEDLCFEAAPTVVSERADARMTPVRSPAPTRLDDDLKGREQRLILDVLESVNGSRKLAAERLGISPRTLRYKLARLRESGIEVPA